MTGTSPTARRLPRHVKGTDHLRWACPHCDDTLGWDVGGWNWRAPASVALRSTTGIPTTRTDVQRTSAVTARLDTYVCSQCGHFFHVSLLLGSIHLSETQHARRCWHDRLERPDLRFRGIWEVGHTRWIAQGLDENRTRFLLWMGWPWAQHPQPSHPRAEVHPHTMQQVSQQASQQIDLAADAFRSALLRPPQ